MRKREDGQATVEFALVIPILILLIFGMMDFGWLFFNKLQINNASREGARYAAIHWEETNWAADTETVVTSFAPDTNVNIVQGPAQVTVTASKNVAVLTGITSTILGGNSVNLSASCTMRLE